ncbi:MAG: hypothetical protein JW798_07475 [Prolixibacteraceae bacterium]|nr:hypothetical protein [Prolixibacteraceae bacterium]
MKTIVTLFVIAFLSVNAFAVETLSGDSNTALGKYKVTQESENLYQLSYSLAGEVFTVEVLPQKNECCYILRGKNIELMYLCNELGFGMRKVPECNQKLEVSAYSRSIVTKSFSEQSQISCARKTREEALGLIACFFPEAIQPDSYNTVFKVQAKSGDPLLSLQK